MLELSNIGKKFGDEVVLRDIDLQIEPGEIVSILGSSGSGKTTLLNIILGILQPTTGKLIFNGEDLTDIPMEKRGFNIVFQDYALFPNLNVYDNITYGLRNNPDISSQAEIDEFIHLMKMEEHLDKKINMLSGGQKQRVAITRTLITKPKIMLMDEPLSALDGIIKEEIKDLIRGIARKYQLTTIIVTHDPEEALTISDKVLILDDGLVQQFASSRETIEKPANDFVKDFVIQQLTIKKKHIDALYKGIGLGGAAYEKA